jgi:hypothetical protein
MQIIFDERTSAQLQADLETAHQALRDVVAILSAIHCSDPTQNHWYEVGRAQGTAAKGLTMSGDWRRR